MHAEMKYRIKNGVETENNEIAAKGFENTDFVVCILVVRVSREILPVGYLKGLYNSESSLMTCVAELHGSVIRRPSSILSHIGTRHSASRAEGKAGYGPSRHRTKELSARCRRHW